MRIVKGILKEILEEDIIDGEITIPEGVIEIEDGILSNDNIIKINLPSTLETIQENTFTSSNIEELEIPASVKSIAPGAFYDMPYLRKISIPGTVENLGYDLFEKSEELEEIILKEGIKEIPAGFAKVCDKLKKVVIPNTVKSIGLRAFYCCRNLESIEIPESVEIIGESAFEECSNLKDIKLNEGLKKIEQSAFDECVKLSEIILPETLEKIESFAFRRCRDLRKIYLPGNLHTINKNLVYSSCNLETLVTPWGTHQLAGSNTHSLIKSYIYLYVNHLLKTKYSNIDELEQDEYVGQLLTDKIDILYETKDAMYKFKTLYSKMRRAYNITPSLLEVLKSETVKNFDYKIWNQVKDIVPWEDFPSIVKAFANILEVFGIFHEDKNQQNRIRALLKLFTEREYKISEEEYEELLSKCSGNIDKIKKSFQKTKITEYFFNLNEIPSQFEIYLSYIITEEDIKRLKKINGTFGRELNNFIKENYEAYTVERYELIDTKFSSQIRKYLLLIDINNQPNIFNIGRIFEDCDKLYNPEFYDFLMKNLELILGKKIIQEDIPNIQHRFKTIQNYYMYQSGNQMPSLKQALDYLSNNAFDFHPGNYELAQVVKKAGVDEQETYDFYQEQFEINDIRRKYSLIRRSNIYKVNGYTIKAELLRKDDPFTMLVGEDNYTNCCQKYHGVGHNCMVHAVRNLDGGIFITKLLKYGEEILLTQSWDWQNNNLYCHDNVEGTPYFKKGGLLLKEAVAEAFRSDGKLIIEKSNEEVEKYVQSQRKKIKNLPDEEQKEKIEELEEFASRMKIKLVTIGEGNDDLEVERFFFDKIYVDDESEKYSFPPFQPIEYNFTNKILDPGCDFYSDSSNIQYIVAGDNTNLLVDSRQALTPIYRDERRIVLEKEDAIRDYTMNKVKNIQLGTEKLENNYILSNRTNKNIYLGEDWYVVFEKGKNQNTQILDITKKEPAIEDEKGIQLQEIIHTIYSLIRQEGKIEAFLRGDRIIKLYEIHKKLGYIEPIFEEKKIKHENYKLIHVIFEAGPNLSKTEHVKQKII